MIYYLIDVKLLLLRLTWNKKWENLRILISKTIPKILMSVRATVVVIMFKIPVINNRTINNHYTKQNSNGDGDAGAFMAERSF
jgi:hypothetical protein